MGTDYLSYEVKNSDEQSDPPFPQHALALYVRVHVKSFMFDM
jgi:hypothetical protein